MLDENSYLVKTESPSSDILNSTTTTANRITRPNITITKPTIKVNNRDINSDISLNRSDLDFNNQTDINMSIAHGNFLFFYFYILLFLL